MKKKTTITEARYALNEIAKKIVAEGQGEIIYKKEKPYIAIIPADEFLLLEAIKEKGKSKSQRNATPLTVDEIFGSIKVK
jgi:hypothetical protein